MLFPPQNAVISFVTQYTVWFSKWLDRIPRKPCQIEWFWLPGRNLGNSVFITKVDRRACYHLHKHETPYHGACVGQWASPVWHNMHETIRACSKVGLKRGKLQRNQNRQAKRWDDVERYTLQSLCISHPLCITLTQVCLLVLGRFSLLPGRRSWDLRSTPYLDPAIR